MVQTATHPGCMAYGIACCLWWIRQKEIKSDTRENVSIRKHGKHKIYKAAGVLTYHLTVNFFYNEEYHNSKKHSTVNTSTSDTFIIKYYVSYILIMCKNFQLHDNLMRPTLLCTWCGVNWNIVILLMSAAASSHAGGCSGRRAYSFSTELVE